MAINIGMGGFNVPTMPDELMKNVSGSVSGMQDYLMNLVGSLPGWAPMAAGAALILGPFALIAASVVLFLNQAGNLRLR